MRFKSLLGVCGIIVQDNKILLLYRDEKIWAGGKWALPAGHIDGNEAASNALARELYEEIGVTVLSENLQFAHVAHCQGDGFEYVTFYFIVQQWSGSIVNNEPEKHTSVTWFDIDSLPENLLNKDIILSIFKSKKRYSEVGWAGISI